MSKLVHVFLSTIPYVKMVRPDGKELAFRDGKYITDDAGDIAHITSEINAGHPHIKLPEEESQRVVESGMLDPMNALRARMEQEIRAQIAAENAAGDVNKPMGETKQEPLKPASSVDIAQAALGGSGLSMAERIAAMKSNNAQTGANESNGAALFTPPAVQ